MCKQTLLFFFNRRILFYLFSKYQVFQVFGTNVKCNNEKGSIVWRNMRFADEFIIVRDFVCPQQKISLKYLQQRALRQISS